jgi:hypothetical protein
LECGLRHITYLEPSEDSPLVFVPTQSGQTDILFLIDATTLHPSPGEASGVGSLFALDEWTNLSQRLASLPEQISAAGASIRTAVTAFGDFDARLLSAPEVRLLLHPADLESRLLRNFDAGELLAELRRIPVPAPDGDYIDALAEGLESCLHAGWRDDARKLVVVFGDSAGYSAVEEQSSAMQWANARFRALDVYDQAAQLHRRNIELASIFHDPGANALKEAHTAAYELIRASRKQFQRLASLPGWAFTTESLASDQIPLAWSSACHPLGRGACPGILLN